MPTPFDPDRHLPLKPDVLYVLLVLAREERHGYAIMRDVAERSGGAVQLQTGALYRMLKHLLADRLIEEAGRRNAPDAEFERRRYYRITRLGAAVVSAEAERLGRLAYVARQTLAGKKPRLA